MTVVLELLRGAELEATSRKYGVAAATLTSWREAFLEGGEAGLKSRTVDIVDQEKKTLKSAVTGLVMDNELLRERIRHLEDETHRLNPKLLTMIANQRVPYPDALAKYAPAFRRMFRSSVTRFSSLPNRRISSSLLASRLA